MAEPKQLAIIASVGHLLHPKWPERSLRTWLDTTYAGAQHNGYRLAVAAVACWADPATSAWSRLKENGPWWRAADAAGSTERGELKGPPRRGEDCERHPGQWRHHCSGCRADKLVEARERAEQAAS